MAKKLVCDLQYRMAVSGIKTLVELQRLTGISRVSLTALYNNDSQRLDFSSLVSLCEVLECGMEELFLIVDEKMHNEKLKETAKKREEARRGFVYFIKNPEAGLVKIGRTRNIDTRIHQLEWEYKSKLSLIKKIPTDNAVLLEKEMHERYSDFHIEGEWFELPEETISKLI